MTAGAVGAAEGAVEERDDPHPAQTKPRQTIKMRIEDFILLPEKSSLNAGEFRGLYLVAIPLGTQKNGPKSPTAVLESLDASARLCAVVPITCQRVRQFIREIRACRRRQRRVRLYHSSAVRACRYDMGVELL